MARKNTKEVKQMKSTLFRLNPAVHKALRMAALDMDISMNEALTQAVEAWLKQYRRKGVKK